MSASDAPAPQSTAEEMAVRRALAGLDEMAEQWARSVNLTAMVASIMAQDDRESRIEALVKLAWGEGAYTGRRSHG